MLLISKMSRLCSNIQGASSTVRLLDANAWRGRPFARNEHKTCCKPNTKQQRGKHTFSNCFVVLASASSNTTQFSAMADDRHEPTISEKITFLTNQTCPYAQRTCIALNEKGVAYQSIYMKLHPASEKAPWFFKYVRTRHVCGCDLVPAASSCLCCLSGHDGHARPFLWRCIAVAILWNMSHETACPQ